MTRFRKKTFLHGCIMKLISAASYQLDKAIIANDLSHERPLWILSSYGPGRYAPIQLFGGPIREQSFEEMRLRHYQLAASGNQQQAIAEAQGLVINAEQQMQSALSDVDGAIRYIVDGENQHPNRIDICKAKGSGLSQSPSSVISGQPLTAFGAPPAFGQPQGTPSTSFGQLGQPTSAFGQPTTFGQKSTALNQPAPSSQPANPFGQAVGTFGQPPSGSPFSGVSKPEPSKSFSNQPVSAYTASAFGQNVPAVSNPFGQQPSAPSNTFGQPLQSSSNPFSRPAAPKTRSFGQPSQPAPGSFGSPAATPQQTSSFGQASPPSNPFGSNFTHSQNSAFGKPMDESSTKRDAQNRLTTWKGQTVRYMEGEPCYKRNDGAWAKIWFPDGAPKFVRTPEMPDDVYDESVKEKYMFMRQHGAFENGIMPDLPPRREWCKWEF